MATATASPEWDWPSGITLIVLWPAFEGTDPGQLETENGRRKGAQGMTMRATGAIAIRSVATSGGRQTGDSVFSVDAEKLLFCAIL
jgi:hypothetical protein